MKDSAKQVNEQQGSSDHVTDKQESQEVGTRTVSTSTPVVDTYSYDTSSTAVMLDVKLSYDAWVIAPFVKVGAGASFNQFSNFSSTSDIQVGDNSSVDFAYSASVGLQTNLDSNWSVSVEYGYYNFGDNASPSKEFSGEGEVTAAMLSVQYTF